MTKRNPSTSKMPSFAAKASMAAMLLAISLALPSAPALAAAPAAGSPVPETVDNKDIYSDKTLKKLGATKLTVFFESGAEQGVSKKGWLLGCKGNRVLWTKEMPLKLEVNLAKTDVLCTNGKIEVVSQAPGCAAFTSQMFSWDGQRVKLVSTRAGDSSQELIDRLKRIAARGNRSQLDHFENEDHNLAYPGNYATTENMEALLNGARKSAHALANAGKPALAAQRMELGFDASQDLVELVSGAFDQTQTPAKWVEAWTCDCMQMPATKWSPLLTEYAQYLQKCGKLKQAKLVLAAVAQAAKNATTAQSTGDAAKTDQH